MIWKKEEEIMGWIEEEGIDSDKNKGEEKEIKEVGVDVEGKEWKEKGVGEWRVEIDKEKVRSIKESKKEINERNEMI